MKPPRGLWAISGLEAGLRTGSRSFLVNGRFWPGSGQLVRLELMARTGWSSRLRTKEKLVSAEKTELAGIREELETISLALSLLAVNQSGAAAANAEERKRYDEATQKGVHLLLKRIEGL